LGIKTFRGKRGLDKARMGFAAEKKMGGVKRNSKISKTKKYNLKKKKQSNPRRATLRGKPATGETAPARVKGYQ